MTFKIAAALVPAPALILSLLGCATERSATVQDQALAQERLSCGSAPLTLDPRLFSAETIQRVEPLYYRIDTKRGPEHRLLGARLRLLAQPGVTAEWLERMLKCDAALRSLHQLPGAPDAPHWLPDGWVDISVRSAGDGFHVSLRNDSLEDAQQILARATAYIGR